MPSNYSLGSKNQYEDLTVPSGDVCQVRRAGVDNLVRAGILDKVDFMSNLVQEEHIDRVQNEKSAGQATQQVNVQEIMKDPSAITNLLTVADSIVAHVVVQPTVKRPVKMVNGEEVEIPFADREDDVVYTDQIDFHDRIFIMNYAVGGDTDLEQFRQDAGVSDGSVESE